MKKRVLFVEDDAGFRYAGERALTKAGFAVIASEDYSQALKTLESNAAVDLLITDIVMPGGINGFALARMGRMRRKDLRVIYITGFDVPTEEADGKILRKPLTDDELVEEAQQALR